MSLCLGVRANTATVSSSGVTETLPNSQRGAGPIE
jgi:hypothetical protein